MAVRGLIIGAAVVFAASSAVARNPVDYVNPEMGWISHMLVPAFPTVQRPNAMMRFLPPANSFADDRVKAFHLLVAGHRRGRLFPVRVFNNGSAVASRGSFAWDQQRATPYSYRVLLDEEDAVFSFAPGEKSALAVFSFERAGVGHVVFMGSGAGEVRFDGSSVRGTDRWGSATAYLFGEFDRKPESHDEDGGGVSFLFGKEPGRVAFRYAVSYISYEQAERNLRREIAGFDFDLLASDARRAWNEKLGKIEVEGGTEADRRVFYTSLWRCYERMVNITEDGRYLGFDHRVHDAEGVDFYTDDWTWDTYRAAHPLMCLIEPKAEAEKLTSYIRMAQQNPEGWVPTFPQIVGDRHGMNGFHPAAIFYDAWRKGIRGVDYAAAYRALVHTERTCSRLAWNRGPRCALDEFTDKHGYFPALAPGEDGKFAKDWEWPAWAHHDERRQAVSVTLAYSYDSWCLKGLAAKFGTPEDVAEYDRKSRWYRNLWNPQTKFFHPKDHDGNWIDIGDYRHAGGQGARDYYAENNAWTYLWDVQHDIPELVALLGGATAAAKRLDEMFNTGYGKARFDFYKMLPDSTGNMGQFTMGNEPSFHIPYLYNCFGVPWKTQKLIRKILKAWFRDDLMGLPGDEDGGGMSAFVVFSMAGIYPVTPGSNEYAIGSPVFSKTTFHLGNGHVFSICAPASSDEAKYVRSAAIGGKPLDRPFVSHEAVASGATLTLEMDDRPCRNAFAHGEDKGNF